MATTAKHRDPAIAIEVIVQREAKRKLPGRSAGLDERQVEAAVKTLPLLIHELVRRTGMPHQLVMGRQDAGFPFGAAEFDGQTQSLDLEPHPGLQQIAEV